MKRSILLVASDEVLRQRWLWLELSKWTQGVSSFSWRGKFTEQKEIVNILVSRGVDAGNFLRPKS